MNNISNIFIILLMLFFHIVDDYRLQGILATMKQKEWWQEHAPQRLYRYDYIMALVMHSLSWSFMIMLPIALANGFDIGASFAFVFVVNAILHGFADDLKANQKKINLIIDQSIHLLQIAATAILFVRDVI